MAVTLTDVQAALIINMDTYLDQALAGGATSPSHTNFLAALQGYSTLDAKTKQKIRDSYRLVFAAWLAAGGL